MALPLQQYRDALIATGLALVIAGCASCPSGCPGECDGVEDCPRGSLTGYACSIFHGTLADDCICGTGCLSQSQPTIGVVRPATCGPDCATCEGCGLCPFGLEDCWCKKPVAGPPPVRFQPPMPPKFLPVPTTPVLSPVRPDAPEPARGDVEFGYGPTVTFPGRD